MEKPTKLEAIELQELISGIVRTKQPIFVDEVIAEVRKSYPEQQHDDIRAAIFPLVSIGEIALDKHQRGKLVFVE